MAITKVLIIEDIKPVMEWLTHSVQLAFSDSEISHLKQSFVAMEMDFFASELHEEERRRSQNSSSFDSKTLGKADVQDNDIDVAAVDDLGLVIDARLWDI